MKFKEPHLFNELLTIAINDEEKLTNQPFLIADQSIGDEIFKDMQQSIENEKILNNFFDTNPIILKRINLYFKEAALIAHMEIVKEIYSILDETIYGTGFLPDKSKDFIKKWVGDFINGSVLLKITDNKYLSRRRALRFDRNTSMCFKSLVIDAFEDFEAKYSIRDDFGHFDRVRIFAVMGLLVELPTKILTLHPQILNSLELCASLSNLKSNLGRYPIGSDLLGSELKNYFERYFDSTFVYQINIDRSNSFVRAIIQEMQNISIDVFEFNVDFMSCVSESSNNIGYLSFEMAYVLVSTINALIRGHLA